MLVFNNTIRILKHSQLPLSLSYANKCNMARMKKIEKVKQDNSTQITLSGRHRMGLIRKLINLCHEDNKDEIDLLLDKEFYHNIENYNYISQILPLKSSVEFYFRDYPSMLMNLQNQQVFSKQKQSDILYIKKALIYLLMDHKSLAVFIKKIDQHPHKSKSSFLIYITSLCRLVLGQFPQGQKLLFAMLNAPFNQLLNIQQQSPEATKLSQKFSLIDKQNPNSLNIKQQIFFNLLCYKIFRDVEPISQSNPSNPQTPLNLYKKLNNKMKIDISDLKLTDYEEFLNIWVSAKYDTPLEWADLTQQQKLPYLQYIYLMAQNSYIRKQVHKTSKILEELPVDYPLRIFLELSQLYDNKKYEEMCTKFQKFQQDKQKNPDKYSKFPYNDIVILNILELMRKMQNRSGQQNNDSDIEQTVSCYKYNFNIMNTQSKGIPFYYLNIPFEDFLVAPQLRKIFK